MSENGLDCSVPKITKFLLGLWFFVCICIYTFFFRHPIGYVFFVWSAIGAVYFGADMKLLETGIQTSHFGIKRLIEWQEMESVRYTSQGAWILTRKSPLLVKIFFPFEHKYLQLQRWRRNHQEAIRLIGENVPREG
jgi:hypothetical protein